MIAVVLALLYFMLSNHFIIFEKPTRVKLLKKANLTLTYTFYSTTDKKPEKIMAIDILRKNGIGQLLVEQKIISEDKRIKLEDKYGYSDDSEEDDY